MSAVFLGSLLSTNSDSSVLSWDLEVYILILMALDNILKKRKVKSTGKETKESIHMECWKDLNWD